MSKSKLLTSHRSLMKPLLTSLTKAASHRSFILHISQDRKASSPLYTLTWLRQSSGANLTIRTLIVSSARHE